MRLGLQSGATRLEAASARALHLLIRADLIPAWLANLWSGSRFVPFARILFKMLTQGTDEKEPDQLSLIPTEPVVRKLEVTN